MQKSKVMMEKEIITKSAEETQGLAEGLVKEIKGPVVITLSGELGAGKTTFVQGFARGLGIQHKILSPTFIIMREYRLGIKNHESEIQEFYHVDLYRLQNDYEIKSTGLLDIIEQNKSIVLIEWPEKMGDLLPKQRVDITFEYVNEHERKIRIITNDQEPIFQK